MHRTIGALLVALSVTAGPVLAQQGEHGRQGQPPQAQGQPPQAPGYQQMERQRDMMRDMDRLMDRIQETNRWMAEQRTRDHFQELGRHMADAGDRIRQMLHQLDQARGTPDLQRDRDRIRDMDHLQDRLHDMERDLDRAHDALRKSIHQP
jgi:hypothetical protein